MKTKTLYFLLGLSLLVCVANVRAVTIAENTGGTIFYNGAYFGQSFTTPSGSSLSNIAFNFFFDVPATTPVAAGTGFLLSMPYSGLPEDLSAATPGFLGQATAGGGFYTFAPSLTLLPSTQYFFYENAQMTISGGNVVLGEQGYLALPPGVGRVDSFSPHTFSFNFRVTGTPVVPSVPDSGSTVMLLGLGIGVIALIHRKKTIA